MIPGRTRPKAVSLTIVGLIVLLTAMSYWLIPSGSIPLPIYKGQSIEAWFEQPAQSYAATEAIVSMGSNAAPFLASKPIAGDAIPDRIYRR